MLVLTFEEWECYFKLYCAALSGLCADSRGGAQSIAESAEIIAKAAFQVLYNKEI